MKKILIILMSLFAMSVNADNYYSIGKKLEHDPKYLDKCTISNFDVIANDTKITSLLSIYLDQFGGMKLKDFDKGTCVKTENISKGVFTTFFYQADKFIVRQNMKMFVAYNPATEKILLVLRDNNMQTFILGNDLSLFERLKEVYATNPIFSGADINSKLTFSDLGEVNPETKDRIINVEIQKPANNQNDCKYDELNSQQYRVKSEYKKYTTNSFEAYDDKEDWQQGDDGNYNSLQNNNFKVLETGIRTVSSKQALQPFLEEYRYYYIYGRNVSYVADRSFRTKILTSDCKVFYYKPAYDFSSFTDQVENANGTKISFDGFKVFLGKALFVKKVNAYSEYDKFEKNISIKTDLYDDYMLRAYYSPILKKISFIQLYTNQDFYGDWAYISMAKDTSGNSHRVTKIDGKADCSGSTGCRLTETLGVDMSEQFLENNLNGFELKLIGKRSKIINISGEVVKSFLKELNKVKK